MKYLKKYQIFLEEADIKVEASDTPDQKAAKDKVNLDNKHIAEYTQKKSLIDKLYQTAKNDKEISDGLKKIIGEKDKNPYLQEYTIVASLKKKIEDNQKKIAEDKIKVDDFNQELSFAKDSTLKAAISAKITDVKNRIRTNMTEIQKSMTDVAKKESESKINLDNLKKNISNAVKLIQNIKRK